MDQAGQRPSRRRGCPPGGLRSRKASAGAPGAGDGEDGTAGPFLAARLSMTGEPEAELAVWTPAKELCWSCCCEGFSKGETEQTDFIQRRSSYSAGGWVVKTGAGCWRGK